jgi:hypothetical protein
VKRQRFAKMMVLLLDFNEDDLLDRDALVAEFYNLAFENKGKYQWIYNRH